MSNPIRFALLQKDDTAVAPEQVKQAFRPFSHLTDADAVRLAVGTHGILMKHLSQDVARAVQLALQAEGIVLAIVAENELPRLPAPQQLRRIEIWPQAFTIYDHLGRATGIPWPDITLVAAGAAQHFEVSRTEVQRPGLRFDPLTGAPKQRVTDVVHKVESGSQLLLDIFVGGGATRYQLEAAGFPFKYVIDRPGLSLEEKFIWLVRQVCRQATQAVLNSGARSLHEGAETVPAYMNPQALADEVIWLLWRQANEERFGSR